jgi:electron transfer flavoprotein alpha subunit
MSVLIYTEMKDGQVKKSSLEAVYYGKEVAKMLGGEAVALSINNNEASALGNVGADKVLNVDNADLNNFNPQKLVACVQAAANQVGAKVVVFAYDSSGKSIAPRLSARSVDGLVSGATSLHDISNGL